MQIDNYVIESLMPDLVGHDRRPSAYVLYLALWHMAGSSDTAGASLQTLAKTTGLSKTSVQRALSHLIRRQLLEVQSAQTTHIPTYRLLRPWAIRHHGKHEKGC